MLTPALLVVDVQSDFCPGGSLPVPHGDEVVPVLNRYVEVFTQARLPIYASRDWHPLKTRHFTTQGGRWPVHCVQGTRGAAFPPDLVLPQGVVIISKGMNPDEDCYSCFEGTTEDGVPFLEVLRRGGIHELFLGGLATDYCVQATTLDARTHRFEVSVLSDAIRGVELEAGDVERAMHAMARAGARLVKFEDVTTRLGVATR
ncbi:MAG: isochorismatase family protein [Candidatus Rokubacteria bacterium]|nr:isochorismatase family protein [Candidatus Rokubacteria bacterium]